MSDINNWNTAAGSGYQYTTAAPDGFPEGTFPSYVNNWGREVQAAIKRRYLDSNCSLVATGSSGAYAVTATETVSALYDGLVVGWQANHANTGPATLAWDGSAAKAIRKDYNIALNAGDIVAGQKIICVYDGTNEWWQALTIRSTTGNTVVDTFTGDGTMTAFVLSADPVTKKNLKVFISGVYQQQSTYSVSGTTLTFTTEPPLAVNIEVLIETPTPAAAVDDDSVGTDQLASGTAGGLVVFDGSGDPTDIGAGTAGQVLTSNGSATPSWSTGIPTGTFFPYVGLTAPSGYVLASGKTIGSASSLATERANADTEALFLLLWASWSNNEAPVTGGRGASAAADWAANKVIAVPDLRGSAFVGLDNMGGSAAGRITSASTNGENGIVPGGRIGAQTHLLTIAEMPSHSHVIGNDESCGSGGTSIYNRNQTSSSRSTGFRGGSEAHSNTQPSVCMTMIIKL